jgi:hypothetical protein
MSKKSKFHYTSAGGVGPMTIHVNENTLLAKEMKWLKLRSKNLFERIGFFLEINKHKSITVFLPLENNGYFCITKKIF